MSKTRNKGTTKAERSRPSVKRKAAKSGAARVEGVATVTAEGKVRITKTVRKGADVWRIERPEGIEVGVTPVRMKKIIRASAKSIHATLVALATK